MDFSEKWGTDVDTAVELALADLKLTIDEVDVTVLEEPSRGFFGIGSKLALVRVEKKKNPDKKAEDKIEKNDNTKALLQKKAEKSVSKKEPVKKVVIEEPKGDMEPCDDHVAISFLKEVTDQMGLNLDISAKLNDDNVYVDIQGKDSGTIIGKRGQTLDAIQYLTSLVVNKDAENYVRVVVDAENYRSKREKTLEQLAERLAEKVVKTKKSVRLEPMNPYERKVIHATLQNSPHVITRSEGQDPYRRVIIELK
ncbi:MAG: protein jag [Eubacteriales bacterium]|nr:protein jag [Eubacteriales bacterium]